MDHHEKFVHEVSRVEDTLHRTRPLARVKKNTTLWHFPFLRDGHCRIYECGKNTPMKLLCHDKNSLSKCVESNAILKKIYNDANTAELAFTSREESKRLKYPVMTSTALNQCANRLLGMIEQDDLYVDEEQIVPNDGSECELCRLTIFSSSTEQTCKRPRCDNAYHRECIMGIEKSSLKSTNKQFAFMPIDNSNDEWICASCVLNGLTSSYTTTSGTSTGHTFRTKKQRRKRCNECAGCRRPRCGKCRNCLRRDGTYVVLHRFI